MAALVPGLVEGVFGPGGLTGVVVSIARLVVSAAAMVVAIGLLLRYAPGERVEWRWVGTGALVTVGAWLLASLAFAVYLGAVINYDSLFGALALPFILLTYLYLSALVLLFGVWLERRQRSGVARPVQAAAYGSETED